MKLQSVEEFFHKRETVEKYNVDKIIKLNWECPDVLFSFRGVYAICLLYTSPSPRDA